jgi:large subunit ribosomal protein L3
VKRDGYSAAQIGFGEIAERKVNKPMAGPLREGRCRGQAPSRPEVRLDEATEVKAGDKITVDMFADGFKSVHVTGVSKGKGFAGVMKRHNFSGGPGGHGSHAHRAAGLGRPGATPSRVFKGTRMPGSHG